MTAKSKGTTTSASEVAKSTIKFDVWTTHQACVQVGFSDLPRELRAHVDQVLSCSGKIPTAWTRTEAAHVSPELVKFLKRARNQQSSIFSADAVGSDRMLTNLSCVLTAWERLKSMRKGEQIWSEADYVGNVYNLLRSPAVVKSTLRLQCSLALPKPPIKPNKTDAPLLAARTIIPDAVVLVRDSRLRKLAAGQKAPFNVLSQPHFGFAAQATPRVHLSPKPCFEFASSVWEDKKPSHEFMHAAYSQNRMAAAAAARQLHAFGIEAPVFGLVWGDAKVRAHVDWVSEEKGCLTVNSAPFPGPESSRRDSSSSDFCDFHEWDLRLEGDILQVYLVVENIDAWTEGPFSHRVVQSVTKLAKLVATRTDTGKDKFRPWRPPRVPRSPSSSPQKENIPPAKARTSKKRVLQPKQN